jgi:hypothetical protein
VTTNSALGFGFSLVLCCTTGCQGHLKAVATSEAGRPASPTYGPGLHLTNLVKAAESSSLFGVAVGSEFSAEPVDGWFCEIRQFYAKDEAGEPKKDEDGRMVMGPWNGTCFMAVDSGDQSQGMILDTSGLGHFNTEPPMGEKLVIRFCGEKEPAAIANEGLSLSGLVSKVQYYVVLSDGSKPESDRPEYFLLAHETLLAAGWTLTTAEPPFGAKYVQGAAAIDVSEVLGQLVVTVRRPGVCGDS